MNRPRGIRRAVAVTAAVAVGAATVSVWATGAAAVGVASDESWAGGAGVIVDVADDTDTAAAVALQPDGKVLVAGSAVVGSLNDGVLMRRNVEGAPDTSFGGGDGMVVLDLGNQEVFNDVAVAPDGKIIAAGWAAVPMMGPLVVRFLPNGDLDPTFGNGGVVVTDNSDGSTIGEIVEIVVMDDGSVVAAGNTNGGQVRQGDVFVARYTASGARDPGFGDGSGGPGVTILDTGSTSTTTWYESFRAMTPLDDGALVATGQRGNSSLVVRFTASGHLDRGFNGTGWRTFDFSGSSGVGVVPRPGGKMVVGHFLFYDDFRLTAVDHTGALDPTFGHGGSGVTSYHGVLHDLGLDPEGRIVTVGGIASFKVARFSPDGAWDHGFGDPEVDLFPRNEFSKDVLVQPDGRILIAGDGYQSYDPAPSGGAATDIGIARVVVVPDQPAEGYGMVSENGSVYSFGNLPWLGNADVGGHRAVDIEASASGTGYWIVDDVGHVFSFGAAGYHGGAPALRPGERITSLAAHRNGYWLFSSAGRVFPYGDAPFHGDMAGTRLNGPVLDSIPTPTGRGYYMVASDGGVFTFGDASFAGSMGDTPLNAPVQSLVPDPDGRGYWLVASDGGTFSFDAGFHGSMGAVALNRPVTGMVGYADGYLMVGEDGGIFTFGDVPFHGSLGDAPPPRPIVSVTTSR